MTFNIVRQAFACSLVLVASLVAFSLPAVAADQHAAPSAAGEQVGFLPLNVAGLKTWTQTDAAFGANLSDSSPDQLNVDFVVSDPATNARWMFPAEQSGFYKLLASMNGASSGNVAGLAYVGTVPPTALVSHGAWVALLNSAKAPSEVGDASALAGAQRFEPASLSVKWSDRAHNYVLTDGNQIIAEAGNGDQIALNALQSMIRTYGLNAEWTVPSEQGWPMTPVGSQGPMQVFLKVSSSAPLGMPVCTGKQGWLRPECWTEKL
jgi:hypothetical protein